MTRTLALVVAVTLAVVGLSVVIERGALRLGVANAQTSPPLATLDAGSLAVADAGPAIAPSPAVPAPVPPAAPAAPIPPAIADPESDPAGFIAVLRDAWSRGWGLAILLGVVGLLEVLSKVGKNVSALAWLGKGRVSLVIGGALSVTTAALAAELGSGKWSAALIAAALAGVAYWHQAGTDPAKA